MPELLHIEPELAAKAESLFRELGLDLTTAVHLFLRQAVRENALPFTPRLVAVPSSAAQQEVEAAEPAPAEPQMEEIPDADTLEKRWGSLLAQFEEAGGGKAFGADGEKAGKNAGGEAPAPASEAPAQEGHKPAAPGDGTGVAMTDDAPEDEAYAARDGAQEAAPGRNGAEASAAAQDIAAASARSESSLNEGDALENAPESSAAAAPASNAASEGHEDVPPREASPRGHAPWETPFPASPSQEGNGAFSSTLSERHTGELRQAFLKARILGTPLRRIRSLNRLYAIGEANPHVAGWREVYVSGDEPFALDFGAVRVELNYHDGGSLSMMNGRLPDEVLESDAIFPRDLSAVFSSIIGQPLTDVTSARIRRNGEESEHIRLHFANGCVLCFAPSAEWGALWLMDARGSILYAPDSVWRRLLGERVWLNLR